MNLLSRAILLATDAHGDQVDLAGEPYIRHPLRVMEAAHRRYPGSLPHAVVAVLHDVIEDTSVSLEHLGRWLSSHCPDWRVRSEVLQALEAITRRRSGEGRPDEPQKSYWARCAADPLARDIKYLDIEDNYNLSRLDRLYIARGRTPEAQAMVCNLRERGDRCWAVLRAADQKDRAAL